MIQEIEVIFVIFPFRNYYDNTTFCFCDFDQFCNSGGKPKFSAMMVIALVAYYTSRMLIF